MSGRIHLFITVLFHREKKGYNYSKFLLNMLVNCPIFFARVYSHMTYS